MAVTLNLVAWAGIVVVGLSAMEHASGADNTCPGNKQSAKSCPSPFDEVIWHKAKPGQLSFLYLVLTDPKARSIDAVFELAERYAEAALQAAIPYEADKPTIMLVIREDRKDEWGTGTGFSRDQLRASEGEK